MGALVQLALICLSTFFVLTLSHDAISSCPSLCRCIANNKGLQAASCSGMFDVNSGSFESYPDVHVLTIKPAYPDGKCIVPRNVHTLFPQIYYYHLVNCSLNSIPNDSFRSLTKLQEVDLSHNQIKKLNPNLFVDNSQLRYVNIQNNPLHLNSKPFLVSKSIWELNLSGCNLTEIPANIFKGLPDLKYLSLSDNRLRHIYTDTIPARLKTLNLASNEISTVPIGELSRLRQIREIDLSGNPVNCTCELLGYQNWVSSMGVIFVNSITCTLPTQYYGKLLVNVPYYDICQGGNVDESSGSCEDGETCSNNVVPNGNADSEYQADEAVAEDDSFKIDEVIPVKRPTKEISANDLEGSGEEEDTFTTTEKENPAVKESPKSTTELPNTDPVVWNALDTEHQIKDSELANASQSSKDDQNVTELPSIRNTESILVETLSKLATEEAIKTSQANDEGSNPSFTESIIKQGSSSMESTILNGSPSSGEIEGPTTAESKHLLLPSTLVPADIETTTTIPQENSTEPVLSVHHLADAHSSEECVKPGMTSKQVLMISLPIIIFIIIIVGLSVSSKPLRATRNGIRESSDDNSTELNEVTVPLNGNPKSKVRITRYSDEPDREVTEHLMEGKNGYSNGKTNNGRARMNEGGDSETIKFIDEEESAMNGAPELTKVQINALPESKTAILVNTN